MKYEGKIYGKVAGEFFYTGKTSDDWDKLEAEITELKRQAIVSYNEVQELRRLGDAMAGVNEDYADWQDRMNAASEAWRKYREAKQ